MIACDPTSPTFGAAQADPLDSAPGCPDFQEITHFDRPLEEHDDQAH